jgi:hypothetical protein
MKRPSPNLIDLIALPIGFWYCFAMLCDHYAKKERTR